MYRGAVEEIDGVVEASRNDHPGMAERKVHALASLRNG